MTPDCNDSKQPARLVAWALISTLALIAFWPLVLSPTQMLYSDHSDMLAMHVPMKHFLVQSFQQTGRVPYWCPSSFAGLPLVHDVQLAAFYPLHWPLYLLHPDHVGAAVSWLVVLHVMIAGWGMFCYARLHVTFLVRVAGGRRRLDVRRQVDDAYDRRWPLDLSAIGLVTVGALLLAARSDVGCEPPSSGRLVGRRWDGIRNDGAGDPSPDHVLQRYRNCDQHLLLQFS